MSDVLNVRVYNVRFGDAILITLPDRDPKSRKVTTRRILIDVGNAPTVASPEGGDDAVFKPVVDDILKELDGKPLDLYVMTHEHLDHVQGLPFVAWKHYAADFQQKFRVNRVWLTASSAPDYYDQHPDAREKKLRMEQMHLRLSALLASSEFAGHLGLVEMLANNDPSKTKQCVEFLRQLNPAKTTYVYRGVSLKGKHPFREAKLEIWAPEEDTSEYYGRLQPLTVNGNSDESAATQAAGAEPLPPAGVDVGAFLNLVEARKTGIGDNVLAIDQAANNTSVVFMLEWRGWRLLFPGDAESRSWKTMAKQGVLKPVHFLKVAHHGSHNGTPDDDILERILPQVAPADRNRLAAISTWTGTYSGIPHPPTDARLKARAALHTTLDDPGSLYFDLEFPG